MKTKILTTGAMFIACLSFGAGFQVLEQGASNIGSAMAGATSNASGDASSAFWNPSAAFFSGIEVGEIKVDAAMNFVIPHFDFDGTASNPLTGGATNMTGNDGGNAGELAYVPNFYSVYRISEDFLFSLSITSPYGLETDYTEGWIGRYHALNSELTTIDMNPSIAWKPTEWLSVSAGFAVQWIHAHLTQATPINPFTGAYTGADHHMRVSGDGWGFGATLGMAIKYAEGGRLGISWRSKVAHSLSGNACLDWLSLRGIGADLTIPQTINAGIYQRLWGPLDRFAVMLDYAWTGWSCFEYLTIIQDANGQPLGQPVHEDWKNTSRVSLGVHYYPEFDENLVLRCGITWDESPVKRAEHRTARIPCADRVWFACGVGYVWDNITFDVGYMYIMFPTGGKVEHSTTAGKLSGEFTGHANVVSAQIGIKF